MEYMRYDVEELEYSEEEEAYNGVTDKGYKMLSEIMPEVMENLKERANNPQKYIDKIKKIESLTKQEITSFLELNEIFRNSQNWRDYSKAKRLIFDGEWIDEKIYDSHIDIITEYLGLWNITGG